MEPIDKIHLIKVNGSVFSMYQKERSREVIHFLKTVEEEEGEEEEGDASPSLPVHFAPCSLTGLKELLDTISSL